MLFKVTVLKFSDLDFIESKPPRVTLCLPNGTEAETAPGKMSKLSIVYSYSVDDPASTVQCECDPKSVLRVKIRYLEKDSDELVCTRFGKLILDSSIATSSKETTIPLFDDEEEEICEVGTLYLEVCRIGDSPRSNGLDVDDDLLMGDALGFENDLMSNEIKKPSITESDAGLMTKTDHAIPAKPPLKPKPTKTKPESLQQSQVKREEQQQPKPVESKRAMSKSSSWVDLVEKENMFYPLIRDDVTKCEEFAKKLIMRIQSIVCTSETRPSDSRSTFPPVVLVRLSILPLPGKVTILRSTGVTKISESDAVTCSSYAFENKSALLSLSVANARSKQFKEGGCPRLFIEILAASSEASMDGFHAMGSAYLPALETYKTDILSIPLLSIGRDNMKATIIFELNANESANMLSSFKSDSIPPSMPRGEVKIDLQLMGLCGASLKKLPKTFQKDGVVFVSLGASATQTRLSLLTSSVYDGVVSMQLSSALYSRWPQVDMIELKFSRGLSIEDDSEVAYIPVKLLVDTMNQPSSSSGKIMAFNAFKLDSASGQYLLSGMQFVVTMQCSHYVSEQESKLKITATVSASILPTSKWGAGGNDNSTSKLPSSARQTGTMSQTALNATKRAEVVKSTCGFVTCCVQGVYVNGLLCHLEKVLVEVVMHPERVKKRSANIAVSRVHIENGDISGYAEVNLDFTEQLAWALQQKRVSSMRINIIAEGSIRSNRKVLGSVMVDLSSLVNYTAMNKPAILQSLLPVLAENDPMILAGCVTCDSLKALNAGNAVIGWVHCGWNFGVINDKTDNTDALHKLLKLSWLKFNNYPIQYTLGLSMNRPEGMNESAVMVKPVMRNMTLHLALSDVIISSNDLVEWFGGSTNLSCVFVMWNDVQSAVSVSGAIGGGGKILLASHDVMIKCSVEEALSGMLCVYLVRPHGSEDVLDFQDGSQYSVVGEASIFLSLMHLQMGVPINMSLPIRGLGANFSGDRVGLFNISIQSTSLPIAAAAENKDTLTAVPSTASMKGREENGLLSIEFCEGNLIGAVARMEPFFDYVVNISNQRYRTHIMQKANETDAFLWNLKCDVLVSLEVIRTTLASNNFMLEMHCRDASTASLESIGWARMTIPWPSISKAAKGFEQWITLTEVHRQDYEAVDIMSDNAARGIQSRIKIRIKYHGPVISIDSHEEEGIGAVCFRCLGTKDGTAREFDNNIDGVSALKASAFIFNINSEVDPDNPDAMDAVVFSSTVGKAAYYSKDLALFNDQSLGGILKIPGGNQLQVRMDVSSVTSNHQYTSQFPAMNTLPSVHAVNISNDGTKHLELALNKLNKSDGNAFMGASVNPKLFVETAFIPYVSGKLTVACTELRINETYQNRVSVKNEYYLRYVLGTPDSEVFNHSNIFALRSTVDGPKKGGVTLGGVSDAASTTGLKSSKRMKPASTLSTLGLPKSIVNGQPIASCALEVDTERIINEVATSTSYGTSTMIPIYITLWEIATDTAGKSITRQHRCIAISRIATSVLYYQATRDAASSALVDSSKNLDSCMVGQASFSTPVELYDPVTRRNLATIAVSLQFNLERLNERTVRLLESTRMLRAFQDIAHVELGLKQSFLLADTDKSGSVSAAELLNVIVNAASGRTLSKKKQPIGMENTVDLLLSLATHASLSAEPTLQELEQIVKEIFIKLDVDGDGQISWWEWKNVLSSSLSTNNPSYRYLDCMDPLVIGMLAARDALQANNISTSSAMPMQSMNAEMMMRGAVLIPMQPNQFTQMADAVSVVDDIDINEAMKPSHRESKAVSRLQSMVKSLRLSNSILAQRFESALREAEKLSIDVENPQFLPAMALGAQGYLTKVDVEQLEARIHDFESNEARNIQAFLEVKQHADKLSAELLALRTSKIARTVNTTTTEQLELNRNLNEQVKQEIQAHAEKIQAAKARRLRKIEAKARIRQFLRKFVAPRIIAKRRWRMMKRIARFLTAKISKSKMLVYRRKLHKNSAVIQKYARGYISRARRFRLVCVIQRIQSRFRGRKGRKIAREAKRIKELSLFYRLFCAENMIRSAALRWRAYTLKKKNEAAKCIQSCFHKKQQVKAAKKELQILKEKRDYEIKLEEARRQLEEMERLLRGSDDRRSQLARLETDTKEMAASVLQTAMRIRLARNAAKRAKERYAMYKAFREERAMVAKVSKPDFTKAVDYWLQVKDGTANANVVDEARESIGKVEQIRELTRVLEVAYLRIVPNSTKKGKDYSYTTEFIPYDHPHLVWFSASDAAPTETLKSDVPDIYSCTLDYYVSYSITGKEINENFGRVVKADVSKNSVEVQFGNGSGPTVWIPHDHPYLFWYKDGRLLNNLDTVLKTAPYLSVSLAQRPFSIRHTIGFLVEIRNTDPNAVAGENFVGTVTAFSEARQKVTVTFQSHSAARGGADSEEYPFLSNDIVWIEKPSDDPEAHAGYFKNLLTQPPANEDFEDVSPQRGFIPPIDQSVGWYVNVQDAEGDMWAQVVDYNVTDQMVVIHLFDASGNLDHEPLELPYMTPGMVWSRAGK